MMKIVMLLVLVCASTLDAWGPGRGGGGGGGRFSGGKGPGGAGGRFQGGRGPGEQGTGGAGRRFQGGRGPGEQGTVGAGRRFPDGKGPGGAGGRRELSCDMIPEDRSCPPFEREVCGTDGNTYSNICELMKVRCYGDDSTVEVDYPCACGSDDCARPTPGGRPTPDKRPDFGGERQRPSGAGRPDVERPSAQEINGKPDGRRPPHGREPHGRGPHGRGPHGRGPHGGGPHRRGPHGRRPDLARLNISVVCNMSENCSPKLNKTVCGTDNITYSTFCELLAVKCETEDTDLAFEHPGDCGEGFNPDPEKRQQFCEMQFEECENRTADIDDVLICGSDNVTYNRCEFKRARCLDMFLTIAKRGECTEDQGDPEKYCVKCPFSFDGGRSEGGRPDGGKPEGRGGQETRGRPDSGKPKERGGKENRGRSDRGKPKGLGKPKGRGGQENRGRPDSGKPKERGGQENRGRPDSGKPKGRGKPENRGGQENRGRQDGGEQEDGRRHHGGSHHGRSHHGGSHHGRHHGGGRRPHHGTEHPVCGTDGVTYPSACELKREACLLRDFELDIETFGPCATSETITEGPIDP